MICSNSIVPLAPATLNLPWESAICHHLAVSLLDFLKG